MLRATLLLALFGALASAELTEFLSKKDSHTWNSLIYAESMIPEEHDVALPQLGHSLTHTDEDLLANINAAKRQLESILSNEDVLSTTFANYRAKFENLIARKPNAELYSKLQDTNREQIFKAKLISIATHNLAALVGKATWTQGVNSYTHLSDAEFSSMYLTKAMIPDIPNGTFTQDYPTGATYGGPASKDWNAEGYVTSVKSQGGCGSCYAFAGLASLESAVMIKYGKNYAFDLAEQEIVDCTTNGCNGGNAGTVYDYEQKNGIAQEGEYGYTGKKSTCQSSKTKNRLVIPNIANTYLKQGDENAVADAVAQYGPAVTVLNAKGWNSYREGTFQNSDKIFTSGCDQNLDGDDNHVVLITGYTSKFFWIKNSWDTDWGIKGYMKLQRGKNLCMVAEYVNVITGLQ